MGRSPIQLKGEGEEEPMERVWGIQQLKSRFRPTFCLFRSRGSLDSRDLLAINNAERNLLRDKQNKYKGE